MKYLLLLFLITGSAYAGTACSTITRTNNGANAVLTSSKYNADHNTAYTRINDLPGNCIQDGTLEFSALATAEFGVITNGTERGCEITRSDGNTISVASCLSAVNGNQINTATSATVAFGCTGCASDVASTEYYVYIKDGSTGVSLDGQLLISTTAPTSRGYDGSDNKALGKFRNDGSSSIASGNIVQYKVTGFQGRGMSDYCRFQRRNRGGATNNSTGEVVKALTRIEDPDGSCGFGSLSNNQVTINKTGIYRISGYWLLEGVGGSVVWLENTVTGEIPMQSITAAATISTTIKGSSFFYHPGLRITAGSVFELKQNTNQIGVDCKTSEMGGKDPEVWCTDLTFELLE